MLLLKRLPCIRPRNFWGFHVRLSLQANSVCLQLYEKRGPWAWIYYLDWVGDLKWHLYVVILYVWGHFIWNLICIGIPFHVLSFLDCIALFVCLTAQFVCLTCVVTGVGASLPRPSTERDDIKATDIIWVVDRSQHSHNTVSSPGKSISGAADL